MLNLSAFVIDKNFKAKQAIVATSSFLMGDVRAYTTSSFFKPYKGLKDVTKTIASPIYAPLAWSALSIGASIATFAYGIASLAYLLMSGVTHIQGKKEMASDYFSRSTQLALFSGFSALLTPGLAIMAVVSCPENLVKVFSRAASSVQNSKQENSKPSPAPSP